MSDEEEEKQAGAGSALKRNNFKLLHRNKIICVPGRLGAMTIRRTDQAKFTAEKEVMRNERGTVEKMM